MSPEDGFSKDSRKNLKRLKKAIEKEGQQRDLIIFAGRERAAEGVSDTTYVKFVRRSNYNSHITMDVTHGRITKKVARLMVQAGIKSMNALKDRSDDGQSAD